MPVIANTAYPRLSAHPPPAELETAFTPTAAEIAFAARRSRQPVPRLALLVLLKAFQRLGYFPMLAAVPAAVVEHIARGAGVLPTDDIAAAIAAYDGTTYRVRLAGLVRTYLGVIPYDRSARAAAVQVCLEAARTRDDLADIINAAIEELVRCRYELPAFDTVLRIARTARALVNRGYYRRVAATLSTEMRGRLLDLLAIPAGETRSAWDRVKTEPKRPSPQRMREFIAHLQWLREQCVGANAFAGVPDQKIRQFAAEARTLNAAALSAVVEPKRLTLVAALLRRQAAQALDDLADMFIRLTQRMHNRAKLALAGHQARHAEETDALVAVLRETVLACRDAGEGQARLAAVEALLLPDAEGILERCEAHAAIAGNNHLPLLARFYPVSIKSNGPRSCASWSRRGPSRPRRTGRQSRRSRSYSLTGHTVIQSCARSEVTAKLLMPRRGS